MSVVKVSPQGQSPSLVLFLESLLFISTLIITLFFVWLLAGCWLLLLSLECRSKLTLETLALGGGGDTVIMRKATLSDLNESLPSRNENKSDRGSLVANGRDNIFTFSLFFAEFLRLSVHFSRVSLGPWAPPLLQCRIVSSHSRFNLIKIINWW